MVKTNQNTDDLAKQFERRLEDHIRELEKNCAIEFVPVIIKKASSYYAWSLVYGLVLSYLIEGTAKQFYWNLFTGPIALLEPLLVVLVAFLFAFLIRTTSGFAYLVPKATKNERTTTMAQALFASEQVFETSQRLGVLVAVFEFEKTVLVLADRGYQGVVPDKFWKELGEKLAFDFNHKNPGNEFFDALTEIEKSIIPKLKLKEKDFGQNPNELSDHLRKK